MRNETTNETTEVSLFSLGKETLRTWCARRNVAGWLRPCRFHQPWAGPRHSRYPCAPLRAGPPLVSEEDTRLELLDLAQRE